MDVELIRVEGVDEATAVAAELLAQAAGAGAQIALSGGSTPGPAHELAARLQPDWSRAGVWWGDERCVPPGDERSNYRLAAESLLDLLREPPAVHRIRGELTPQAAALEYDEALRGVTLDLALLGIGPDGHTASLFPSAPSLDETSRLALAASPGLEPLVERVTLSLPALASVGHVVFLVVGADKAEAVERAFARPPDRATPASLVRSREGRTTAIVDTAAAARLT